MLRVGTSDLILDEIDGYDPKPLVAVLRVVTMAALMGRNVVASSATLSFPTARLVWRAFRAGLQMRHLLHGLGDSPSVNCVMLDDMATTPFAPPEMQVSRFEKQYRTHLDRLVVALSGKRQRVGALSRFERNQDALLDTVRQDVARLHAMHHVMDPITGRRISVGLVRMANITPAVTMAKFLADRLLNAKVLCYHSQLLVMHRHHIESTLDRILKRKGPNWQDRFLELPEIRAALDDSASGYSDVVLIVVATPVEEIGRDHDFDWAIIEPSSIQSIVQTAGRVNRHRRAPVTKPNVGILQFNWRECRSDASRKKEPRAFCWPGLESAGTHDTHDIADLIDWQLVDDEPRVEIDARLRFDPRHRFSRYDDAAIDQATKDPIRYFLSDEEGERRPDIQWMAQDAYTLARLRDGSGPQLILQACQEDDLVEASFRILVEAGYEDGSARGGTNAGTSVSRIIDDEEPHPRAWLALSVEELVQSVIRSGLPFENALCVRTRRKNAPDSKSVLLPTWHRSFGFYYPNRKNARHIEP